MAEEREGFRFYYDKSFEYILNEERLYLSDRLALISAKKRLRMYANLFNRDMRKKLINEHSTCVQCNSKSKLQIDHIVSIDKGGKNIESNIQILCWNCNRSKSNN